MKTPFDRNTRLETKIVTAKDLNASLQAWLLKYGQKSCLYYEDMIISKILCRRFKELSDETIKLYVYYDTDVLNKRDMSDPTKELMKKFRKRYQEILAKEAGHEAPAL
jgi:hypothetical protein